MTARVTLADVTPAIALGPLDGRYRAAVAPLVDHLSEAALNRERCTSRSSGSSTWLSTAWCRARRR